MTPYLSLEVVETKNRREGRRFFVRDDEESHLWNLVEFVGHPAARMTCYCPDGEAHAESPGTEPECVHLRSVVEHIAPTTARPRAAVNVSGWVD